MPILFLAVGLVACSNGQIPPGSDAAIGDGQVRDTSSTVFFDGSIVFTEQGIKFDAAVSADAGSDLSVIPLDGQVHQDAGPNATLAVNSTVPQNDATSVAVSQAISITFSEPISAPTVTASSLVVRVNNVVLAGAIVTTGNTATFTANYPFPIGTRCAVTATTAIKSISGSNLAKNHTWTFGIRTGEWGQTNQGPTGRYSKLTGEPSTGDAVLTWWSSSVPTYANGGVYAAATDQWVVAAPIDNNTASSQISETAVSSVLRPNRVAMSVAAITASLTSDTVINAYRYNPNSGAWSGATKLNNLSATRSTVAIDNIEDSGNAMALWAETAGPNAGAKTIWSRIYQWTGNTWETPKKVWPATGTVGAWDVQNVGLSLNRSGTGFATWYVQTDVQGLTLQLWSARVTAAGTWEAPVSAGSGVRHFSVEMDNSGNGVAIWQVNNGLSVASYKGTSKTWNTSKVLRANLSSPVPRLAIDAYSGNAAAIWVESANGKQTLWTSYYNASNDSWSLPAPLDSTHASSYSLVDWAIAMNRFGHLLISWVASKDTSVPLASRYSVHAATYAPDTKKWTYQTLLDNTSSCSSLTTTLDNVGRAWVVWQRSVGAPNGFNLHSARFQ